MPEAENLLARAAESLRNAEEILRATALHAIAAREAYIAVLQAARAIVLQRTGRVVKTHRGLRANIGQLAQQEPRIGTDFAIFLGRGFDLKLEVDYGTDPRSLITRAEAEHAIVEARRLVEHARSLLAASE